MAMNQQQMQKQKKHQASGKDMPPDMLPQKQQTASCPPPTSPHHKRTEDQYLIKPPGPKLPNNNSNLKMQILKSSPVKEIIEKAFDDEYSDSIRMLVLLENGEQRYIAFSLPNGEITVQELLSQVGVPFTPDVTPIRVTEMNEHGLHYIVTVGNTTPEFFKLVDIPTSNTKQDSEHAQTQSPEAQTPLAETKKPPLQQEEEQLDACSCGFCNI